MSVHARHLDPYHPGDSMLHRLDERVKLPLALGLILATALVPPGGWAVYILLFSINLALALLSSLGPLRLLKRALLAIPFALAALPLLFTTPGEVLFNVVVGTHTLTASLEGLLRFLGIGVKSWLSIQGAILLTATTQVDEVFQALRFLKVPRILVAIISLMWRYLFVMTEETSRLLRARSARSGADSIPGRRSGGSAAWRARVAGGMAGSLILRSLERSERVYAAMLARGYDGEIRSLPVPHLAGSDWLILILGLAFLLLLTLFGLLMG